LPEYSRFTAIARCLPGITQPLPLPDSVCATAITAAGNLCGVKGPGSASFDYTVQAESAANTWSQQVATIKGDDGQACSC
jgi:hypothetical protein